MKQKVQIDVLDVSLYDGGNNHEGDDSTSESDSIEKKSPGNKWWKSKIIWFTSSLTLASLLLGLTIFLLNSEQTKPKGNAVKKVASPVYRVQSRYERLQDCIINFKDRSGKDRFLLCALILEKSSNDNLLSNEDLIVLRKGLYNILQKKSMDELSLIQDKNKLKDELLLEISERLNSKFVSKIYFAKFVIL